MFAIELIILFTFGFGGMLIAMFSFLGVSVSTGISVGYISSLPLGAIFASLGLLCSDVFMCLFFFSDYNLYYLLSILLAIFIFLIIPQKVLNKFTSALILGEGSDNIKNIFERNQKLLAQKILEKYKFTYLSIDHLKMGFIRSKKVKFNVQDDDKIESYLWPILVEIIKTNIENKQNLVIEGCYIPFDWKNSFNSEYIHNIKL